MQNHRILSSGDFYNLYSVNKGEYLYLKLITQVDDEVIFMDQNNHCIRTPITALCSTWGFQKRTSGDCFVFRSESNFILTRQKPENRAYAIYRPDCKEKFLNLYQIIHHNVPLSEVQAVVWAHFLGNKLSLPASTVAPRRPVSKKTEYGIQSDYNIVPPSTSETYDFFKNWDENFIKEIK